ncbi:MAG TPA: carboxypeptidase regulatory-like domain-containing protein [Bryobacteraceae bacterium]|jgi:hypothetical protein
MARCNRLLLLLAAVIPSVLAQERGSISGTVADSSGAAVPGVTVQITDTRTNVTRSTATNSVGYYIVGGLIPGPYTVVVEAKGFKRATRPPFTLEVAQAARVDIALQVGDVSESVSVSSAPPLLATSDATVGQVIGPVMMSQLPLNDRNYLQLALISPGTGTYGKSSFYNSALTDNSGAIFSGSAGEDRNAFSLDGADIKAYLINGSFVPSIDAVQEFKIETTPYSAELGTSPGAQILLVTKNGTDQLHGSAYEFLRNDAFDAKNYFDNPELPIPKLRKNQFGATIGGPILKDKLFYFVNYEGNIQRIGETFFGTVPTSLQRQRNFTEVGENIYNPFTTASCASCSNGFSRTAFPNNTIPSGLISPVSAEYIEALFPLPTAPGLVNNYAATDVDRVNRQQFNIRIDYSLPKDSIFGRFSFNNSTLSLARGTFNSGDLPGFGDNDVINTRDVVVGDDHTFNPTTVLDMRVAFFRQFFNLIPRRVGDNLNEKLGIQGVLQSEPFNSDIAGISNPGSNPYAPEFRADNQYSYSSKLTKIAGAHSFVVGGEFDRWQVFMDAAPSFPQGQFSFDGTLTADPNNPGGTGNAFADFLLGYPESAVVQSGDSGGYMFRNNARWFVSDQWRATPNLTLNFGLRWEYDGPFYEKYNRLSNFDPDTGQLIVAGRNFVSRTANVHSDWNNYAPRFGFAYTVPGHQNTTLRGGYGIFYDVIQENNTEQTRTNPPFSSFPFYFLTGSTTAIPTIPTENVFGANSGATPPAPSIEGIDQGLQMGYQQQASFGFQQQLGSTFVVEANYNWQKNTKFSTFRNLDAPVEHGTFVLPYPEFSSISYLTNIMYGNYNALLVRAEKRFSAGWSAITAFTWSKNLDNISSGSAAGAPGDPGFQSQYCFSCDYGRSAADFQHRFVQSIVYDIPGFGSNRLARILIGGWELSGIFTYQGGFPVTPLISGDNSQALTFADRPNVIPGAPIFLPSNHDPAQWFNPGAFQIAPLGQYGDAGKGIIEGPHLIGLDCAAMKNFRFAERYGLQVRAEVFNAANHPNFAGPTSQVNTPSAGAINSTVTTSRQIQLGMKLTF